MKIFITGIAGFIGFHLANFLLKNEFAVIGLDNLNDYYDPSLKHARLSELKLTSKESKRDFIFIKGNLEDYALLSKIFSDYNPDIVINLAAQAGVRYSLENPKAYLDSNIIGFSNIVECCKINKIDHLIFASSSSVYGGNTKLPFSESQTVDHPISLYAATKKANELIAHTYSHLYDLKTTGLRFFTVYGPWGRPDMALFKFTKSILNDEHIDVYNNGDMIRDFTYIDDIVKSIFLLLNKKPEFNRNYDKDNPNPSSSWAPYKIFNIGNSDPQPLMDYIKSLEYSLNKKAKINFLPMQPGDVKATYANTDLLQEWIGFKPKTTIKYGINEFIKWYKNFYKINN